jgi:beta-hydroxylase
MILIYKIIITIVLLVIVIVLFSNDIKLPPNSKLTFFDPTLFPVLKSIHIYRPSIIEEVQFVLNDPKNWEYWPEKNLYDGTPNSDWKIFPYYAFGIWVNDNCSKTPILTKFIKSIPNLKLATLSKLSPGMKLVPHRGWGNHSNNVLRCHYGLFIPGNNSCYVRVRNEIQYHENDKWLVFDDSKTHMAENASSEQRVVLIIDITRPKNVPKGTSLVGDTKELIDIVNYFTNKQINSSFK